MIVDNLSAAEKYYSIHPIFKVAFEYLKSLDLQQQTEGEYTLEDQDFFYIVMDRQGLSKEEAIEHFECHNAYIDIQLCVSGKETIGWKSRDTCCRQKASNDREDYIFFDESPDMYFELTDNQFAIFFPGDVHAPMIGKRNIRKVVVKVKM